MSEDAAAAAGTADGAAGDAGTAAGDAGAGPAAGADDRTPEEMLADAASGTEGADDDGDLAAQLRAARAAEQKWKNTVLKAEARANKNADAAKRLQEIEDSQKTELQRATEAQQAAEQRAAEAEGRYHRTLAAATYGLPPTLIDLLSGGTEDEINASAETLAAEINARVADQVAAQLATATQAAGTTGNGAAARSASTAAGAAAAARGRRPVESMRPGGIPSTASAGAVTDANQWLRSLYEDSRR
jgi:hypothetical protein